MKTPRRFKAVSGLSWLWLALASPAVPAAPGDRPPPNRNYYAYVCAESEDEVTLVRFGPEGLEAAKTIVVGSFPAEIEGPHGIAIAPDGRHWYVSLSHGFPYGTIHKYETGSDEWVGDVTVGLFPATLAISPATGLLYVVNFNLYGERTPSSISVVETSTMTEVARVHTGIMPHGARLSRKGDRLYSVNMMQDELIEVDTLGFAIVRRLLLPVAFAAAEGVPRTTPPALVEPTWVTSPTADARVYVAGQKRNAIYEVDLPSWKVTRVLDTPRPGNEGPYNLAVSSDAKTLVATYKKGAAVGFWDLTSGEEVARIPTTRRVPHGVVVTDDDRYVFATVEGVGAEPGTVEVYSVADRRRLGSLDVGKQAGGIALWQP